MTVTWPWSNICLVDFRVPCWFTKYPHAISKCISTRDMRHGHQFNQAPTISLWVFQHFSTGFHCRSLLAVKLKWSNHCRVLKEATNDLFGGKFCLASHLEDIFSACENGSKNEVKGAIRELTRSAAICLNVPLGVFGTLVRWLGAVQNAWLLDPRCLLAEVGAFQ